MNSNVSKNGQGSLGGIRVAAVVFSHFPSDPRPRREAETLVQEGAEVEVISLMQEDNELRQETFNGVSVTRVRLKKQRGGKLAYFAQYFRFILTAFFKLSFRSLKRRYHLVHVHNMPDVLVFSALFAKLLGARVILDQHDPMPELMMSIYGKSEDSRMVRLLKLLERWSLGFADAVITVNLACIRIFTGRGCPADKLNVVMNSPDEGIFQLQPVATAAGRDSNRPFVIMYHGSIVERHGLDLAVEAVSTLLPRFPNLKLRVYGRSTPFLEQVMVDVKARGIEHAVECLGGKSLNEIVAAIDACDVGIIPNRRSIFTEINTPTRIFEYLSRGKPVIAPRAGGITDYFDENSLILFELGSAADLAKKIEFACGNSEAVAGLVRRGQAVYSEHRWSAERKSFLELVGRLTAKSPHRDVKSPGRESVPSISA